MSSAIYNVTGMSCDHCVQAVTKELEKLDGVVGVAVDLDAGTVTISSDAPLDEQAVRTAVDEAGYELLS